MIRKIAFVAICWICLASCASRPEHFPLSHRSQEIALKVKTISLLEMQIPSDVGRQDEVRAEFANEITRELEFAGFNVIPSTEYSAVYNRMMADIGGIFDPSTGNINEDKAATLRNLVFREMVSKHAVDAFCQPSLKVTKAEWVANRAEWHGASEATTGEEGFWAGFGTGNYSGSVPALSVEIVLFSADGTVFYDHLGGIQLLAHFHTGGPFQRPGFRQVPAHELLSDPTRIQNALRIALGPLLGRRGAGQ